MAGFDMKMFESLSELILKESNESYASLREAQAVEKLEKENFHLAANQCNQPIAGEGGNMECGAINQAVADYKERVKARLQHEGFSDEDNNGKIIFELLDTTN
jgi:hypothetical protein